MILLGLALGAGPPVALPGPVWELPDDERLAHALRVDLANPVLYPSFAAAAAEAPSPVLASGHALALATRRADEAVLVGLARRPDRQQLVRALLRATLDRDPSDPAVVWLGTALQLGGSSLDGVGLGSAALEQASRDAAATRQRPLSRPVAPWSEAPDLRDAWARDRWLAEPASDAVAAGLAATLANSPELLAWIEAERALHRGLYGDPPASSPAPLLPAFAPLEGWPADPQGGLPARRAWATAGGAELPGAGDEPWSYPDPPRRVVPATPPGPGPAALPLPEPLVRHAQVSAWAAEQPWAVVSGAADALASLAARQRAAAALASRAAGLPTPADPWGLQTAAAARQAHADAAATEDVRAARPVGWSAAGRPRVQVLLGIRHLPVLVDCPACERPVQRTLLAPALVELELARTLSPAELRALAEAHPRAGDLLAALRPPRAAAACAHALPGPWVAGGLLALLRRRRRDGR